MYTIEIFCAKYKCLNKVTKKRMEGRKKREVVSGFSKLYSP